MAIDRSKAVADLSQIKMKGNTDGLMPAMGVLIQFLPASFWNSFTEKMLRAAGNAHYSAVAAGLERAAHECGYHTGYGIINSDEFKAAVGPMIQKVPDDVLHGAYAVFTAWGWANAEIVELVANERMTVRAYSYYEAEIRDTLTVRRPCAYMIQGVSAAFMDLGYGQPYPNGLGTFRCEQTKGIEVGDPYGEFVVVKA
jgi:hypothetical protein